MSETAIHCLNCWELFGGGGFETFNHTHFFAFLHSRHVNTHTPADLMVSNVFHMSPLPHISHSVIFFTRWDLILRCWDVVFMRAHKISLLLFPGQAIDCWRRVREQIFVLTIDVLLIPFIVYFSAPWPPYTLPLSNYRVMFMRPSRGFTSLWSHGWQTSEFSQ